jgi:hypothetical protein
MSFNYQNGVNHNSMHRASFGGYDDGNGYGAMVPYQEEYKPQIYRVRTLPMLYFPMLDR